ncbi:MAG: site-specific DNA-methyltransferase [Actinomycetota bacterium]|nr:site-specific DNA-methyltransferase [Actinomycetota bacterium]
MDPSAGYGTTLVVAERMGRRAVGVELWKERLDVVRRLLSGKCRGRGGGRAGGITSGRRSAGPVPDLAPIHERRETPRESAHGVPDPGR